ncbi:hypothetical protein [Methanoregula sp.]|uniref:hypothetical protein n=1 Tax=Methanoregula sp. TaxID=2052170 RepID=UPI0025E95BEC|nr:hypothetical protein [Methanoregula sp.]
MKNSARIFITLSIFLVLCVTIMGCSSSSGSTATTTGTVTTVTTIAPLYTAGDIVWSSSASTTVAWLIISYDPSTESYTRAYIHKNTDGTWGYRTDSATESSPRSTMEKVYPVKVTHVTVSSIPTAAPTPVPTTVVTTQTTITVATTTTTAAFPPIFKDMSPDSAYSGDTFTTIITGAGFVSTPTVKLTQTGSASIVATSVTWDTATQIEATFSIPNTTSAGLPWTIVITNPNNQSVSYANEFTVHEKTTDS